ncbi:ATP-binding protein [Algoriphagus sediminis]|uniref:ATP-binding protein n=1 Tax=Algoriphagus sediminis TaxID=3057113 RepID=A0ABT7YEE0_9BACT|nr:ATP-binding protein [Algoriphagus sediminis]MDN3204890.1 ATP-binding protein [Algoriphagus sediminis]
MNNVIKLYCQTASLAELRKFLQEKLEESAISDALQLQLILAVEEVCANLIIHSHHCNQSEHISVQVSQSESRIIFEIRDQGDSFNLLEYDTPKIKQVVGEKRKGGIGIILVKKIMDEIKFSAVGKTNICQLIKKI